MTTSLEAAPKDVKALPAEAQALWVSSYNQDFGWRCSEAHAQKAAWRAVAAAFEQRGATWTRRA